MNNAVMFTWEAIYPLFAFTRNSLGGLELSVGLPGVQEHSRRCALPRQTQTIGVVLAFSALLSILQTVFIFPVLHRMIPETLYLQLCERSGDGYKWDPNLDQVWRLTPSPSFFSLFFGRPSTWIMDEWVW